MKTIEYLNDKMPNTGGWQDRHRGAIATRRNIKTAGGSVVCAIESWTWYAIQHQQRFEAPLSEDYFLGPLWAEWGKALRGLLNGDLGAFDCGTLDTIIHDNASEQGFDPNTW